MNEIFSGKCVWDFSVIGNAIILDDELSTPVEMCKNKIIFAHSPSPDIFIYMQNALALVTETGGVLCHAAVLAMELGCPIIVGADGAIKTVKNMELIRLEGINGKGIAYEATI